MPSQFASVVALAAILFNSAEARRHNMSERRHRNDNWDMSAAQSAAGFSRLVDKVDHQNPQKDEQVSSSSCPQSPSKHRIDSLPYWSMESSLPCFYSGHLLSSDKYENYFYYWMTPRPDDLASGSNDDSPLIVYLNGGPGSTSMNALWTGSGPLRVVSTDSKVKGKDFAITYDTTISWQSAGDLLFIDQPVGTGWSYGENEVTDLDQIGDEFLTFMINFYEEFPVYKTRELMLTGESFAGKYLAYSSRAILDYNDAGTGDFTFNFNNLFLSDPLVDTPTERLEQNKPGWALGYYDDFQTDQVEALKRRCEEGPSYDLEPADLATNCKDILNYITVPIGSVG